MDNLTTTDTLLFGTGNKKSFFTRVFLSYVVQFFLNFLKLLYLRNGNRLPRTSFRLWLLRTQT